MRIFGLLLGLAIAALRKRPPAPPAHEPKWAPDPCDTPDRPLPFGFKTNWLAVRSDRPERVTALFSRPVPANWESGLALSQEEGRVFVSPPIGGYVLAVGVPPFPDAAPLLEAAALEFADVQYFGSHRVVDYFCWARYLDGRLVRGYCYVGESGQVLWNQGELTQEERALGFDQYPQGDEPDWDSADFPTEESVLAIAAAWGADPASLGVDAPPSAGWLCQTK